MASKRIYANDEHASTFVVDVYVDPARDFYQVTFHDAYRTGGVEGTKAKVIDVFKKVIAAIRAYDNEPPSSPQPLPEPVACLRCTLCGAPRRDDSGACINGACADPLYDLRVDTANEFINRLTGLGASVKVIAAARDVMDRTFVKRKP